MDSPTVSHYRIIKKLGAGGMGEVYLAQDTNLDRKVALKLLPVEFTAHAERVRRFVQEAKAASALNHPNIITIYEIGETDGTHYIVTEYIEGETLRRRFERARMTTRQVLDVGIQIASALSAAHTAGIIHRDIKPENIMLRPDGYIKVLDFGLAKLTEQPPLSTDTSAPTIGRVDTDPGIVMGTVSYMSPEQARGQMVDARSDIFSLGVVIYEMLAGRSPFQGGSAADIFVAILEKAPIPLAQSSAEVPPGLERVVFKCLEKDRELRYASAQALAADLKSAASTASSEQAAVKVSPSIAVLPFVNMSADPENDYFCSGLAEELLNALSKIEALKVAARTSAFSFRAKEADISVIGRKLNVGAVLEGSVRKSGNRLRITVQLINVSDGYHLWSERYDRELQDIFDIQDEISLAIVDVLKVKLLGAEKAAVLKRYTDNPEAYQLYLKGRFNHSKWTAEGFRKSTEYYEQALEEEPDYAPAFAALSINYIGLWYFGFAIADQVLPKAQAMVTRALALDESLAESHLALAELKFYYERDWSGAEREVQRAIELSPNYVEPHEQYGALLAVIGSADAALVEAARALELAPLSLQTNFMVGWAFFCAGELDLAREQGHKLIGMEPGFFGGHSLIGCGFFIEGKYDSALTEFESAVALGCGREISALLGCVYGITGKREKAEQILTEVGRLSDQGFHVAFQLALVHAGLGDMDRALALLDQACEQREGIMVHLKTMASFVPELSADPRLAGLLQRIGLPE